MRDLVIAIYMTPQGPQLETKLDPRSALRLLAGISEDLREVNAVEAAKVALKAEQRIEVVPANGVILGKRGS